MKSDLENWANRIQKVLEDANIKLGSVASNVLGVSGREMLKSLMAGQQDPKQLAALARGRLREKSEALQLALDGCSYENEMLRQRTLENRRVAGVFTAREVTLTRSFESTSGTSS